MLELLVHDETLLEDVGKPCHDQRVEHVDLQEETVANMEAVERYRLEASVMRATKLGWLGRVRSAIAGGQGMVDRNMELVDEGTGGLWR